MSGSALAQCLHLKRRNSSTRAKPSSLPKDNKWLRVRGLDAAFGTATAADGTRSADVADPWPSATADARKGLHCELLLFLFLSSPSCAPGSHCGLAVLILHSLSRRANQGSLGNPLG